MDKDNQDKSETLFDAKGYFIFKERDTCNGYSLDALVIEKEWEVDAFIKVEGKDTSANYHETFKGNGLPAKAKAAQYFESIKALYIQKSKGEIK